MVREGARASVAVIGAGPAGLMAAEVAAAAGCAVGVFDRMPSPARKLLMAGKSGLNVTHDRPGDYPESLRPMLAAFGPREVRAWMDGLGQPSVAGPSGRVFPVAMKASPLLRAWLARLEALGVTLHPRARWTGWDGDALAFEDGGRRRAGATVLAMGGASWRRLGSDGAWVDALPAQVAPFAPSNAGVSVAWSAPMARHVGAPLKNVVLHAGGASHRGEVVVTRHGLEGGGLYPLTPQLRAGAPLAIDLKPDLPEDAVRARLARRGSDSASNRLRKLGLDPVAVALVHEAARPLPADMAPLVKRLPVAASGLRPLDEAISTAGGLRFDALDGDLMLRGRPGTFAAGEMLDWEMPTGGYLLTACLATGAWAGRAAARWARARAGLEPAPT